MSATSFRVLPSKSSSPRDRTLLRQNINKALMVVLLVAPGMILFLTFVLVPVAQSARYSLYDWDGFGQPTDFIGFDNYERLYEHNVFRSALQNSFTIMLLSLVVQLPIAMTLALLVGRGSLPGRRFFRALLFIPYVFSEVIVALIWWYVYHPNDGLATTMFTSLGLTPIEWLGDKNVVVYSIFLVLTWKYFGYYMILYMAGLQGVQKDLEEAARVDGANWWQALTRITMPLMGPTIRLTVYLSVLGSFQQFVIVQTLTRGGNPFNTGHVLATYLYKFGIQRFYMGYGSAVAVVLFLITLVFSLGYQRVVLRRDFTQQDMW